jgi:hypothetical protein
MHYDSDDTAVSPHQVYGRRLGERRARVQSLGGQERLLGNGRVLVFLLAVVVGWLAFGRESISGWWLLVTAVGFLGLLVWYDRVLRSWRRARRASAFYEAGLARLNNEWMGKGNQGLRFQQESHPYATDLDLFGPGSVFELLCGARTAKGEETLASWVLAPGTPAVIRLRQGAIAELASQLDLREDLAVLADELPVGADFDAVAGWGEAEPLLPRLWLRWPTLLLGVATLICFLGWFLSLFGLLDPAAPFGGFFYRAGILPFVGCVLADLIFLSFIHRKVHDVLRAVERRGHDLALLAGVLARVEETTFHAPRLRELQDKLIPEKESASSSQWPSRRIGMLCALIDVLNSRRNQLFAPFAFMLLWGAQLAFAIESWRRRSGKAVRTWVEVVGEFEALCSLARHAYENPDDPFPTIVQDAVCFDGEGLGHPLLPVARCVRNDIHLHDTLRVLIVSGSNMSGKSTFLRTVGVNAVLALAGAPVRAHRLKLSPLAVGGTLRIQDSLQAGRSRFYAEILRIRQLVDLARGQPSLLFLLDELLAGTNSHDRRHGAEAIIRGLVEAGAIGLLTTHDLSLTHIAEQLDPRAANVHFADHFENDEIHFDYQVRPGVVQKSNALELMRAVGLDV